MKKSFIRLQKLKERWFIAVVTLVAKSSSDSKVEEWDLNKEWEFRTGKYTTEKFIAEHITFKF